MKSSRLVNIFSIFFALFLIVAGYAVHVGDVFSGEGEFGAASCSDATDNDLDGQTDCDDSDCTNTSTCGGSEVGVCADGIDNDEDGITDCADSADCSGDSNCMSSSCPNASCDSGEVCAADCSVETYCDDGVDNDEDGYTDSGDSDCAPPTCPDSMCMSGEACSADCSSETYCSDGVDNDQDGYTDNADADCGAPTCPDAMCVEGEACSADCSSETYCSDGVDNDEDGQTDDSDSDCSTVPPPGTPDLLPAYDTGISDSDDITKNTIVQISVSCESGRNIGLLINGSPQPTFTCSDNSYTFEVTLSEGPNTIIAKQDDSTESLSSITIAVDTTAPNTPNQAPYLDTVSDSGISDSDGITDDSTPYLSLQGCDPSNFVYFYEVEAGFLDSVLCNSGTSQITSPSLSDGIKSIYVTHVDVAGNESSNSGTTQFTIDTVAPLSAPSTAPDLDPSTDTGVSSTDNITNTTAPMFNVACDTDPDVDTVLYVDGILDTSVSECLSGSTSVYGNNPGEGEHLYTLKYIDTAGNMTSSSPALSTTFDITAPSQLPAPDLTASTDGGSSSTDNITSSTTLSFAINCPQGNYVSIQRDDIEVSTSLCDSADFVVSIPGFSQGDFVIKAQQYDAAGNYSTISDGLTVTVDTTPLTITSFAPSSLAYFNNATSSSPIQYTLSEDASSAILYISQASGVNDIGAPHRCILTGSALLSGSHTLDLSDTVNGCVSDVSNLVSGAVYNLQLTASDNAGAIASLTHFNITFDTTLPSVSITSPSEGSTASGTVAITADASDNISIEQVQFYIDSVAIGSADTSAPYSISWNTVSGLSAVSDGNHTIEAVATDRAGNTRSTSISISIDNTSSGGGDAPSGNDNGGGGSSGDNTDNSNSTSTEQVLNVIAPATGGGGGFTIPTIKSDTGNKTPSIANANNNTAPTPSISPVLAQYVFGKNIKVGARNNDVIWLQKFLNSVGVIVSKTGAGSPGKETNYLGPATKKALIQFQKKVGITASLGNFGTITRTYINNVLKHYSKILPTI